MKNNELKRYTQKDVAERAGVSEAFVSNVINGKRTSTRVADIAKELLGIEINCKMTMRDEIADLKRQLAEAQELVKDLAWKEKLLYRAVNYIDEFVNFSKFEVDEHVKENMNAVLATYEVLKKGEK